jgi:hypothetical protein
MESVLDRALEGAKPLNGAKYLEKCHLAPKETALAH